MRRRPLLLALYLAPLAFLIVPSRVKDALEVAVDATLAGVRRAAAATTATPTRPPLPRPPSPRPPVAAFRTRVLDRVGQERGARVVQLRTGGGRFRLVVDRGEVDGVRLGDLAVAPGGPGGGERLVGHVDGVVPGFARVRTLWDRETWWLAATAESRFVLQAGVEPEEGLALMRPEHRIALEQSFDEASAGAGPLPRVCTAADPDPERSVPAGLEIGWPVRGDAEAPGWRVRATGSARAVLALRLQRGDDPIRFTAPAQSEREGDWVAVRVARARDGVAWRESVLVTRIDGRAGLPVDAPVAHGEWIEGWVHTEAGASARVRLVGDPGFYAHVLVLREREGRLENRGGGVFRGAGRVEDGILGRLSGAAVTARAGDLIVVGPHKGAGGVGLTVGEVVGTTERGRLRLRRPRSPAIGAALWVGRFARPPGTFPGDEEAKP